MSKKNRKNQFCFYLNLQQFSLTVELLFYVLDEIRLDTRQKPPSDARKGVYSGIVHRTEKCVSEEMILLMVVHEKSTNKTAK